MNCCDCFGTAFKYSSTSGSEFAAFSWVLVDDVDASRVATTKSKKVVETQTGLIFIVRNSRNSALNDVVSLHEQMAATSSSEA